MFKVLGMEGSRTEQELVAAAYLLEQEIPEKVLAPQVTQRLHNMLSALKILPRSLARELALQVALGGSHER